jgi:hypothetical protein
MSVLPTQPRRPLLVYVDVDVLFFWILPRSHLPGRSSGSHRISRKEVLRLFGVLQRHAGPTDNIRVVTCQWSLVEAHSVLYRDALWFNNLVPSNRRNSPGHDPRKEVFPPHAPSLQQATSQLSAAMVRLGTLVSLDIVTPDAQLWQTALSVCEQCGIYAPDAIHLAAAIHTACDVIVSGDIDFVNKVHALVQAGAITQIWASVSPSGAPPSLEACPLRTSKRLRNPHPTARQYLAQMGYR